MIKEHLANAVNSIAEADQSLENIRFHYDMEGARSGCDLDRLLRSAQEDLANAKKKLESLDHYRRIPLNFRIRRFVWNRS